MDWSGRAAISSEDAAALVAEATALTPEQATSVGLSRNEATGAMRHIPAPQMFTFWPSAGTYPTVPIQRLHN